MMEYKPATRTDAILTSNNCFREDYSQMMDDARIVRLRREKEERERLAAVLAAPPPAKKARKNGTEWSMDAGK